MCSAKQKHGRKAFEFLKGCNSVSVSQMRRRRDGFGPAGETPLGAGRGRHWQRRGVGTDEDLEESSAAERKVVGGLQSCGSCPKPPKTNEGRRAGGVQGSAVRGVQGSSLIFFFFFFGPLALICEENGPEMGGRWKAWP